jgi:dTDP-4-amino-4,6-dideoxygalactose transaminase
VSRWQLAVASPLTPAMLWAGLRRAGGDRVSTDALRAQLQRETGMGGAVLVDSGTSALRLALEAAHARRPGLPVAMPAYGCFDLATAARGAGVPVRLYDLDPFTLQPEAGVIDRWMREGLAALVVVHLFGIAAAPSWWRASAARHGVPVIEDAAQGAGLHVDGRPAGGHGDLAVLSFGRGKGRTGGGGGALLYRDPAQWSLPGAPEAGSRAENGRVWAMTVAQWLLGRPSLYALANAVPGAALGETVEKAPASVRAMAPSSIAMVLAGSEAAHAAARHRRAMAGRWIADLPPDTVIARDAAGQGGALRLPVLLPDRASRDGFVQQWRRFGVAAGYPTALIDLPSLQSAIVRAADASAPGARALADRVALLPTHGFVTEADRRPVAAALRAVASRSHVASGPVATAEAARG